jgi:hypothetical protein
MCNDKQMNKASFIHLCMIPFKSNLNQDEI